MWKPVGPNVKCRQPRCRGLTCLPPSQGPSVRGLLHPDDLIGAGAAGLTAAAQAGHVQPAWVQQPLRGSVPLQRGGNGPGADGRLARTHTYTHTHPEQEWDRAQPTAM